jgi:RHS repeat-associated protein
MLRCFLMVTMVLWTLMRGVVSGQGLDSYLDDWQLVHPSPHLGSMNGVAFGAGRYVIIADGGLVSTSVDLEEWRSVTIETAGLLTVEFLEGQFVAVGVGGVVASSPDGLTWELFSVGSTTTLTAVDFIGGQYYVVGGGGFIAASGDLDTWAVEASGTGRWLLALGEVAGVPCAAGGLGVVLRRDPGGWVSVASGTTSTLSSFAQDGSRFLFAGSNGSTSTTDGGTWSASGDIVNAYAVCAGAGLFVAAGSQGLFDYSTDGLTWQSFTQYQSMGMTNQMRDIIWAEGAFFAVGTGGVMMRSENGLEWTEVSQSAYFWDITGMAHAKGMTLAVGKQGQVWKRRDGEEAWTSLSVGHYYYGDFLDIATDGNRFVLVTINNGVLTSENGVVWTWVSTDENGALMRIKRMSYGDGVFVGVLGGVDIVRSVDGLSWEAGVLPGNANNSRAIDYVNGMFYVPGPSGSLYRSADGVSWSELSVPASPFWWSATAYGNGVYVGIQRDGLLTSVDGVNWVAGASSLPVYPRDLIFFEGQFILVGGYGGVLTSPDGVVWTAQNTSTSNELSVVAEAGGQVVAGGVAGSIVASPGGTFWSLEQGHYTGRMQGLVYAAGQFVAVGASIFISEDGVDWEAVSGGQFFLEDVVWGNGAYVAVGTINRLLWSSNGRVWEPIATPVTFKHVTFGKGYFLASTANEVYKSVDGRNWTLQASQGGRSISFAQDKFFLLKSGAISSSDDGVTWSTQLFGHSNGLNNVAYGNGLYMACDSGVYIYTSADGVSWTSALTAPQSGSFNIYFFDGLFWFTAGGSGLLYSSPDGTTWTKRLSGGSSGELLSDMASNGERMVAMSYDSGTSSQFYALDIPPTAGGEFSFGALSAFEFEEAGAVALTGSGVSVAGVEVMADGSRYLLGSFQGSLSFSPSVSVSAPSPDPTGFIAYFDSSGVVQWARTSTGPSDGAFQLTAHTMRANGNLVFAGTYEGSVHFGGEAVFTLAGRVMGGLVGEVTPAGQILWARNFGRSSSSAFGITGIAIGPTGNYYTTGQLLLSTDLAGTNVADTHGNSDLYLAAYSPTFAGLWAKAIPSRGSSHGGGLVVDSGGNLYLTGGVEGAIAFDAAGAVYSAYFGNRDALVASYAADGEFRWYRHYGGPGEVVIGDPLLESNDNHLILPLAFSDRALLGPRVYEASSSYDLYALRITTADGNPQRTSLVGALASPSLPKLVATLDGSDNLYLTGVAGAAGSFGSAVPVETSPDHLYVTMMDQTGRRLWTRFFGQAGADRSDLGLAVMSSGDLLLAGVSDGPLQFSPEVSISGGLYQTRMEAGSTGLIQPLLADDQALAHGGESVVVHVLSNDEAPSGESLSAVSLGEGPVHGSVVLAGNTLVYTAPADFSGTDTFTYRAVTSGGVSADARVTIASGHREIRDGWAYEDRGSNGVHLNLTRDAAQRWHLGYISREGYVHAWEEGGIWHYEVVLDSSRAISGKLLSDSLGIPNVVFYDPGLERFRYARRDAVDRWDFEELYESDNLITRFDKDRLAMTIGPDDEPQIYLGRNDGVQYLVRSGAVWTRVSGAADLGYPALAVTAGGTPWFAGWLSGYPAGFSRVGGAWPSLDLDDTFDEEMEFGDLSYLEGITRMGMQFVGGDPVVAFSDRETVQVARQGGGLWGVEEVAEEEGQWISIAPAGGGLSHVLYYEPSAQDLVLATEESPGTWARRTLVEGAAVGFPTLGPDSGALRAAFASGEDQTVVLAHPLANTGPIAVLDGVSTFAHTPVRIWPLANDYDAEEDLLGIQSMGVPANGVATLGADGAVTYLPDMGFVGADSIDYVVTDHRGGMAGGVMVVNVQAQSPFDQDADGLNDYWAGLHGLAPGSGNDDEDLDRMSNRDEFAWGSDPNVFNLLPTVELTRSDAVTLRLRSEPVGSRGLLFEQSGDLDLWAGGQAPAGAEASWVYRDYPFETGPAFFRVVPQGWLDLDGDFIDDWLEAAVLGTSGSAEDSDLDGSSDLEELLGGGDPADYFNGQAVTLRVVSGNGLTVRAGNAFPELLGVRVRGVGGEPLAGVPIVFAVQSGDGAVDNQNGSGAVASVTAWTDVFGLARVRAWAGGSASGALVFTAEFGALVAAVQHVEFHASIELSRSAPASFTVVSQDLDSWHLLAPSDSAVNRYYYTYDGSTPDSGSSWVLPGGAMVVPLRAARVLQFVAEESGVFSPLQRTFLGQVGAHQLLANENYFWAVLDDGTSYSMGMNTRGQLGYNTTEAPVAAEDFEPFVADAREVLLSSDRVASASLGLDAVVLLDSQNRVWETREGTGPRKFSGFDGALEVASGVDYHLVLRADGGVSHWGRGDAALQLGSSPHNAITAVSGLTNVARIYAGADYAFALDGVGTLRAWGSNPEGNLGLGHALDVSTPATVGIANVVEVIFGQVVSDSGKVIDYGPADSDAFSYGVMQRSTFALTSDGEVHAWGGNGHGELGLGHETEVDTPTQIPGLESIAAVVSSAEGGFSFALDSLGAVSAWGGNEAGQLGDGGHLARSLPVAVDLDGPVVAVAAGRAHALALRDDGRVLSWGDNHADQLGDGTGLSSGTPTLVAGLQDIVAIAAADDYSLALRQDGALMFWGAMDVRVSNSWSRADMVTVRSSLVPVRISPEPGIQPPLVLTDVNANSIDDDWETKFFGFGGSSGGPFSLARDHETEDFDFDGRTNRQEFEEGTNPHDPASRIASGEDYTVGTTQGQFTVGPEGGAHYTLALDLPGGAAGVTPELSLNYSSNGGNGILGQGWTLGGYGVITRGPTNLATDGYIDGVDFDENDVFYLNGQRLIAVSGAYGADGTEYRTQKNTFARIYSRGSYLGGPEWFELWTKSGLIESYRVLKDYAVQGYQLGADELPRDGVLTWPVESIRDRAGNWIQFEYDWVKGQFSSYSSRNFRLDRILYGSAAAPLEAPDNVVDLVYRENFLGGVRTARRDQSYQFHSGEMVVHNDLLVGVRVSRKVSDRGAGYQLYRGYEFDHRLSYTGVDTNAFSLSRRTTLQTITETGADGTRRAPLCFDYSGREAGTFAQWIQDDSFCPVSPLAGAGGADLGIRFIDLNRDGLLDYVRAQDSGSGVTSSSLMQTRDGGGRWVSGSAVHAVPVGFTDAAGQSNGTMMVDLNRDGQSDILRGVIVTGEFQAEAYLATPGGWESTPGYAPPVVLKDVGTSKGEAVQVIDLNGDALPDFVYAYESAGGEPERMTLLNTGRGWSSDADLDWFLPVPLVNEGLPDNGVRFLDVNGDALPDLLQSIDIGGDEIRRVWLNSGQGWVQTADRRFFPPVDFTTVPGFQDLNGDGLLDIAGRNGFLNTGAGWLPYGLPVDASDGARFVDFNGDGLLDILIATDSPSMVRRAWLNVGYGFLEQPSNSIYQSPVALNKVGVLLLDINGDGAGDIVDGSLAGQPRCWLGQAKALDELVRVFPLGGAAIEIDYARLNDGDGTYTLAPSDPDSGMLDVINGTRVVKAVRTANGLGGESERSYQYSGLRYGMNGEGSLGFEKMLMTDAQTGVVTTTSYRQDFPLAGLPESVVTSIGGQTITRQENTYAMVGYVPSVPVSWFSYTEGIAETRYDLQGVFLGQTTSSYEYDAYGNVTATTSDYGEGWSETITNSWNNNETRWEIGRLASMQSVKNGPTGDSITRNSNFSYDPLTGYLLEEVEEVATAYEVRRRYERNLFGNVVAKVTTGNGIAERTDRQFYDFRQDRVVATSNALGHQKVDLPSPVFGHPASTQEANGLTTHFEYDGFGVLDSVIQPNGRAHKISRFWTAPGEAPNAVYREVRFVAGEMPVVRYFDALDREVRGASYNRSGELLHQDSEYGVRGWIERTSRLYLAGGTPQWTQFSYDALGRGTQEALPDGSLRRMSYNGRVQTLTNALSQNRTTTTDVLGNVIQVRDAGNTVINNTFNADGKPIETTIGSRTIVSTYNLHGNPTMIDDPSTGVVLFSYDALGRVLTRTDAKGQVETSSYDLLGRIASMSSVDGVDLWSWDTAPGRATGLLSQVTNVAQGHARGFEYDDQGRLVRVLDTMDGESFALVQDYDAHGRVEGVVYPTGFAIEYLYAWTGANALVRKAGGGQVLWSAQEFDHEDRLLEWSYGNGVDAARQFTLEQGFLSGVYAENSGTSGVIQDSSFFYDALGNLTSRSANLAGAVSVDEAFLYDNLNRVTSASLNTVQSLSLTYDSYGNITTKSDVGTYSYGENGAPVDAVTSVSGTLNASYLYDANGCRTDGNGLMIAYNGDRKPTRIDRAVDGGVTNFRYGVDSQLLVTEHVLGASGQRVLHVGALYDRTQCFDSSAPSAGGTPDRVQHRHYIRAGGESVAVHVIDDVGGVLTAAESYLHRDHLGSVVAISNGAGNLVAEFSYDAFGRRRNADWTPASVAQDTLATGLDGRGYTGHHSLDGSQLVHMKGRVYDPLLGRFLSPDAYVQAPFNTQSYNRYSYVVNNPLTLTDPSGFFSFNPLDFLENVWNEGKRVVERTVDDLGSFDLDLDHLHGEFVRVFDDISDFVSPVLNSVTDALNSVIDWIGGGGGSNRWGQRNPGGPTTVVPGGLRSGSSGAGISGSGGGILVESGLIGGGHSYLSGSSPQDTVRAGSNAAWTAGSRSTLGSVSMAQGYAAGSLPEHFDHGAVGGGRSGGAWPGIGGAATAQMQSPKGDLVGGAQGKFTRIALAASAGGVHAKVGGGSFKDGVMTDAASRLFTDEAHPSYREALARAEMRLSAAERTGDQTAIGIRQEELKGLRGGKALWYSVGQSGAEASGGLNEWDDLSSPAATRLDALLFGGVGGPLSLSDFFWGSSGD